MKTLLVTLEFPPLIGGVETYYGKIAEHWPGEIKVLDNSRRELVKRSWLPGLFSTAKFLRSWRPDWVLVGEILPIGTIVCLLSFVFKFRYAVFLHGLDFSLAGSSARKRFLTKRILSRCSAVIAVNSYVAAQVKAAFPDLSEVQVVNPGVEAASGVSEASVFGLRENYDLRDKFVVATVARFVKRKGVDMVLRAMPEIIKAIPGFRYVVIGQGPDGEYLKNLVAELNLESQVLILSGLDSQTKDAWLSAADVFAMPARNIKGDYEGFGIVYLEANSFGKPVIAGKSGGVADAVVDGLNGLQVDEENPASIAAAIIRLYRDPELRERLGRQGLERSRNFSWKLQVEKIFAILKKNSTV